MAVVPVPKARATLTDTSDGLTVTVPARKNWIVILFVGFWMIGWACGEWSAISALASPKTSHGGGLFLFAWLGGWTVGGALAGYAWAWTTFGVERLSLRPRTLVIRRDVLGLGRQHEYDLAHVTNLRAVPTMVGYSSWRRSWDMEGTVAFDYGAKTFRFGGALDDAEATQLVQRLKARHAFR